MKLLLVTLSGLFMSSFGQPRRFDSDGLHPYFGHPRSGNAVTNPEFDALYWYKKAAANIAKKNPTSAKAKNIILFMGDGMSVPTLTSARILLAQRNGKFLSESPALSFENFPFSGFSRTYCVDNYVADSACSATAYLGGAKGNVGTIGLSGSVTFGDLKESLNKAYHVHSLASLAQKAKKATGFVTNTRVTHASPAGTYAHIANRDWECDADMERDGINYKLYDDIAEQLILNEPGKNFNVIMGGGRRKFIPKNEAGPDNKPGSRLDGVNLIKKWQQFRTAKNESFSFVTNKNKLMEIPDKSPPKYLLGLFAHDHMDNKADHNPFEPTLEEMTEKALKVLMNAGKDQGYFLFVEGGRIDMAHHSNQAQISLDETIEFAKAVAKADSMTNPQDTLIVVTADHSHTMSLNGYPSRDKNIFGFAGKGKDNLVYTSLSYANGPGYTPRKDLSKDNTEAVNYVFPAAVPLASETHGGDDVAVFARGPNAQMFSGSYEQSYIPHAMAHSAKILPKY